jgi:SAM-dependent methyltransferase
MAPTVLTCSTCGTGIVDPPPNRELVSAGLFEEMYGGKRLEMRPIWFEEARKRLEWVLLYRSHGRLLEVGAGTGEFVRTAIDGGFEAEGVEVSEWAAAEAEKLGVTITQGMLSDWVKEQRGGKVDVVALWHVLEHVEDPLGLLQEILTVVRPGGLLVLEVPNGDAADLRRLGLEWRGTQPSDHYYLYSAFGLRSILERAGYEVRDVVSFSGRIYSNAQAWENERAEALLEGYAWPSLDFLRAVATAPTTA